MKSPQLNEADKRAVDMLLDELPQSRISAASGFTTSAKAVVTPALLEATRLVLSRLDHYEAAEPPADLIARCMARIATTAPADAAVRHSSLPAALTTGRIDA